MCLSAWGLPTYALVRVFSGIFASVLGWGAYLDRQVASGLCGWRLLCFLSTPRDCWPSGFVFILPGSYHILTDALYRPLLLPRSAWSLALTVFLSENSDRSNITSLRPHPIGAVRFTSQQILTQTVSVSGHRHVSPFLGLSPGLRVCSSGHHSSCSGQAPGVLWDGAPSRGSSLGPAPLVPGPAPALAGPYCSYPVTTWAPLHSSLSSSFPDISRLRHLAQRFTRTARLPSAIAERSSLACRSSSRAVCQGQWSISLPWCLSNGFYISRPTYA